MNTAAPSERDSGEKEKQKTVPVVPQEAGEKLKLPAASDSQQSAAPKRKKDKEIPTSEEEGPKKKKISLDEERKPTEYVYCKNGVFVFGFSLGELKRTGSKHHLKLHK